MRTILQISFVLALVLAFGMLLVHAETVQKVHVAVLEPTSLLLLGIGLAGVGAIFRRRLRYRNRNR